MAGEASWSSVDGFTPAAVLEAVYRNHREQGAALARDARKQVSPG